jgi:transposase
MGRVNTPALTAAQHRELEAGFKQGRSHCFRMRCQSVLFKSEGRYSKEAGLLAGMCAVSVNRWLKRYGEEGISGLAAKAGRGRKCVISLTEDTAAILSAIKASRQRMRTAKAQWEAESGRKVCDTAFKAFLKSLADGING